MSKSPVSAQPHNELVGLPLAEVRERARALDAMRARESMGMRSSTIVHLGLLLALLVNGVLFTGCEVEATSSSLVPGVSAYCNSATIHYSVECWEADSDGVPLMTCETRSGAPVVDCLGADLFTPDGVPVSTAQFYHCVAACPGALLERGL